MGTEQLEYAYAGDILKWDDNGDGTIMVYGMATDPTVDLDGQVADPDWLKAEMPEWFKFANVREQHGSTAAGIGKELTHESGDKWMLKSHIVDPGTVNKVKHGVLKGYSIGVRGGKVLRGKAAGAPNGRIVGGKIVEVSLVDRPCNPLATINIAKAAAGSDVLDAVDPVLVDVDPSMYDDEPVGEPIGDAQAVDGAVDDGGELSLFDGIEIEWDVDADEDDELSAELDKALSLLDDVADEDDDAEVTISKGLLESLLNGPKPKRDADGDGQVGEGGKAKKEAEARRLAAQRREAERERERKHRGRMDAERAQDADRASRQGRRMEAGEHRARIGQYDKALSVLEYRSGLRLVHDVLDGVIVKGLLHGEDDEIIAELAEFARAEADALAMGGYGGPEDVSVLLDACAAIAKMAGAEPTNRSREGYVLDDSSPSATLDVAEIVKAQVAEQLSNAQQAHEAELAELRARVEKMAATPLPGGPVMNKTVMPSAPVHSAAESRAAELERQANHPGLAPAVAAGYRALAAAERSKGALT